MYYYLWFNRNLYDLACRFRENLYRKRFSKNINLVGAPLGLQTSVGEVSFAMLIPVIGMILGLLTAVFVTYRKPREYVVTTAEPTTAEIEQHIANIKPIQITASAVAIVATFATQLSQALQLLVV